MSRWLDWKKLKADVDQWVDCHRQEKHRQVGNRQVEKLHRVLWDSALCLVVEPV